MSNTSQKTLWSFFTKKETSNNNNNNNNNINKSSIDNNSEKTTDINNDNKSKRSLSPSTSSASSSSPSSSPSPLKKSFTTTGTKINKRRRISSSTSGDDEINNKEKIIQKSHQKKKNSQSNSPVNIKRNSSIKTAAASETENNGQSNEKVNGQEEEEEEKVDTEKAETGTAEISPKKEEECVKIPNAKMNSFFTNKKEMKIQSVGQGHKGSDYNPAKKNYDPIKDAFWEHNEKVPYLALTKTFELIEEISSRLRMIEVLSNFLRSVIVLSPNDLSSCVYLCLNQLAPAYEGLELGIAETTLMKAIAQTTGRTLAQIKTDAQNTGDLGIVAEKSKSNQRLMFVPAPLTVASVFIKLKEIAKMSGNSAMTKKGDKIQAIFVSCRHSEARFFMRSLLGKLRIGLAEQSLLQALAMACTLTPPNQKEYPPTILNAAKGLSESIIKTKIEANALQIKTIYCQCPNYDKIIKVLIEDGVNGLSEKCEMTPGIPLKPMLAHPTKGVAEVLQRFDGIKFTCEWKYDGERAQIHISENGTVNIYSRNQENNTTKYPDIIARIDNVKKSTVKSCILDCEAVAWDQEKKQILPFQVLSTRKRKDANEADIKVKVCVYMFDLLYFNGVPMTTKPFVERRQLLYDNFYEIEGDWKFATSLDTKDIDDVQTFLDDSVKGNCEGLMVKTLEKDATYEIAKRSRNWLKLKKDYLAGVGDSLDLVVLGGYKGRGKRTGHYGGFLLACYDIDNEEYQSICKIGTGFSDDDLQQHSAYFKQNVIQTPKSYYRYDTSHEPDEWFEPVQVWEVKCADLSLSPVHKAAMGIIESEKGISLRFPRFIRIRDDKKVEDATSAQQVADMYSNQDQIKNQDKSNNNPEEDFY